MIAAKRLSWISRGHSDQDLFHVEVVAYSFVHIKQAQKIKIGLKVELKNKNGEITIIKHQ